MGRLLLVAAAIAAVAVGERGPKHRSEVGSHELFELDQISATSCEDSQTGFAIIDDSLENCEKKAQLDEAAYEKYKCHHWRIKGHAHLVDGKCVCKNLYTGPICNTMGCPNGEKHVRGGSCSKTGCDHVGVMAVSIHSVECKCEGHWAGHFCDKLACYRDGPRWRNNENKDCKCKAEFSGAECEIIQKCSKNGNLTDGACVCESGYGGDICETKCPNNQLTCSTSSLFSTLFALPFLLPILHRLF